MIAQLLNNLNQQQKSSLSKGYLDGIFASQRLHALTFYIREDENIFFSSAIAFTLQECHHLFSEKEKQIANQIFHKVTSCYPYFKNFKGEKTYNFFKTNPMDFFPNGKVMQYFKFFKLADDADDTAYVYLTTPNQNHNWLKQKLVTHANGTQKWSKTLAKPYRYLKAYGVYFGKKMNIEIDVCVLSNILLWHFKHFKLENQQDQDSLKFIQQAILSKDYVFKPYLIAPCYPTTAQICYHVSRLVKLAALNPVLQSLKSVLIQDIQQLLQKKQRKIHQILLEISLMNLGVQPIQKSSYSFDEVLKNTTYFYTSAPLMIPKLWGRKLQKHSLFHLLQLQTKCDGYTTAFLLEHEVLYQQIKK